MSEKGNLKADDGSSVTSKSSDAEASKKKIGGDHIFNKAEVDLERLTANKASFSQIPMKFAGERADNGSIIIGELAKIFQGRVDMEDREIGFSIKVSRPNLYENEIRLSTSERALGEQAAFRRQMDEEVVYELDAVKSKRLAEVARHKESVEIISHEVHHLEEALSKAKAAHAKSVQDVMKYKERLRHIEVAVKEAQQMSEEKKREKEKESKQLMGRFLSAFESTPEQDREKCLKKIHKHEAEVKAKSNDIATKKKWLLDAIAKRDQIYSEALLAFETAEKSRLQSTEKALRKFCSLERQALEGRLKLLSSLEEGALHTLNADADIELFSKREKNVEDTHKYAHAMRLMDWDHARRSSAAVEDSLRMSESLSSESPRNAVEADMSPADAAIVQTTSEVSESLSDENVLDSPPTVSVEGVAHERERSNSEVESKKLLVTVVLDQKRKGSISSSTGDTIKEVAEEEDDSDQTVNTAIVDTKEDSFSSSLSYKYVMEILDEHIFVESGHVSSLEPGDDAVEMTECCEKAFVDAVGMDIFLQILDDKRGRNSVLGERGFNNMAIAMKIFLDKCYENGDVKSALRLANMSITFHKRVESPRPSLVDPEAEEGAVFDHKCYIQREPIIHQHKLWHLEGFWEDALLHGVMSQMDMMEPVLWDELESDHLKEKVVALHNVVFGQLGTMAFTMHEMGLTRSEVETLIMSLSAGAQLGEDQQQDLLRSIGATFQNTVYPSRSNSSNSIHSTDAEAMHDDIGTASEEIFPYQNSFPQTADTEVGDKQNKEECGEQKAPSMMKEETASGVARRSVGETTDHEAPDASAEINREGLDNLRDHL